MELMHDVPVVGSWNESRPPRPKMRTIVAMVAEAYDVPMLDLESQRRTLIVCHARHVAMYLCRHMTLNSLPQIGRLLGDRDHTTVLHGVRKITRLRKTNPSVDAEITGLMARLRPDDRG